MKVSNKVLTLFSIATSVTSKVVAAAVSEAEVSRRVEQFIRENRLPTERALKGDAILKIFFDEMKVFFAGKCSLQEEVVSELKIKDFRLMIEIVKKNWMRMEEPNKGQEDADKKDLCDAFLKFFYHGKLSKNPSSDLEKLQTALSNTRDEARLEKLTRAIMRKQSEVKSKEEALEKCIELFYSLTRIEPNDARWLSYDYSQKKGSTESAKKGSDCEDSLREFVISQPLPPNVILATSVRPTKTKKWIKGEFDLLLLRKNPDGTYTVVHFYEAKTSACSLISDLEKSRAAIGQLNGVYFEATVWSHEGGGEKRGGCRGKLLFENVKGTLNVKPELLPITYYIQSDNTPKTIDDIVLQSFQSKEVGRTCTNPANYVSVDTTRKLPVAIFKTSYIDENLVKFRRNLTEILTLVRSRKLQYVWCDPQGRTTLLT